MKNAGPLANFLSPDPRDVGCGETLRMLEVYIELELAGEDPAARFPGMAAHLRDCHPCREDMRGLLLAAGDPRIR
jgi:hypothetical protein